MRRALYGLLVSVVLASLVAVGCGKKSEQSAEEPKKDVVTKTAGQLAKRAHGAVDEVNRVRGEQNKLAAGDE